jgi:hypothetical protein
MGREGRESDRFFHAWGATPAHPTHCMDRAKPIREPGYLARGTGLTSIVSARTTLPVSDPCQRSVPPLPGHLGPRPRHRAQPRPATGIETPPLEATGSQRAGVWGAEESRSRWEGREGRVIGSFTLGEQPRRTPLLAWSVPNRSPSLARIVHQVDAVIGVRVTRDLQPAPARSRPEPSQAALALRGARDLVLETRTRLKSSHRENPAREIACHAASGALTW